MSAAVRRRDDVLVAHRHVVLLRRAGSGSIESHSGRGRSDFSRPYPVYGMLAVMLSLRAWGGGVGSES